MTHTRVGWTATMGTKAAHKVSNLPLRLPVTVTTALGMKAYRPLSETVHAQALYHRVRHLPLSTVWKVRHRIDRAQLVAWRVKNVDVPYWRKTRFK